MKIIFTTIDLSVSYRENETLTALRHWKYIKMVISSNIVNPENLPPTERAAYFHALRVHLQVAQWKTLSLICLEPKDWG